jgi:hypothetical protein
MAGLFGQPFDFLGRMGLLGKADQPRSARSPDGAERNPGCILAHEAPDYAPLHPGYARLMSYTVAKCP